MPTSMPTSMERPAQQPTKTQEIGVVSARAVDASAIVHRHVPPATQGARLPSWMFVVSMIPMALAQIVFQERALV